jgi:hypothetical protein
MDYTSRAASPLILPGHSIRRWPYQFVPRWRTLMRAYRCKQRREAVPRPPNFKQAKRQREEAQKKRNQEKEQQKAARKESERDPAKDPT